MNRLLTLFAVCLLAACGPYTAHVPPQDRLATGAEIARALQMRYDETIADCGSASRPAFLCSGVLLHATGHHSTTYAAWDPSPASVASGGVAFSYLRKDANFSRLAFSYATGFIFYPALEAPVGKYHVEVLCAFPVDADSNDRVERGCGTNNRYPTSSDLCHRQNIQTAAQWKVHFESVPVTAYRNAHQCGFTVRDSDNAYAANNFYQALAAQRLIHSLEQNEQRLATWPQNIAATVPIHAFFFLSGNNAALADAQANQRDFYNASGHLWVPIIRITLPVVTTGVAIFVYTESDQAVHP